MMNYVLLLGIFPAAMAADARRTQAARAVRADKHFPFPSHFSILN